MLKSLTSNGVIFAVTCILHIGCSRVCLHITLFSRIQPSVQCVANSSFAFWNVLVFFNSNICNPWLVEGNDVITKDMEGQPHASKQHSPMGSGPYMGSWSVILMLCHPTSTMFQPHFLFFKHMILFLPYSLCTSCSLAWNAFPRLHD